MEALSIVMRIFTAIFAGNDGILDGVHKHELSIANNLGIFVPILRLVKEA